MGGDVFVPSALIASAGNNANEYLAKHVAELGYLRPTIVALSLIHIYRVHQKRPDHSTGGAEHWRYRGIHPAAAILLPRLPYDRCGRSRTDPQERLPDRYPGSRLAGQRTGALDWNVVLARGGLHQPAGHCSHCCAVPQKPKERNTRLTV